MITKITKAYTRTYGDNKQTVTYIEWVDHKGVKGRTEGQASNPHMASLLARATREGVTHIKEIW